MNYLTASFSRSSLLQSSLYFLFFGVIFPGIHLLLGLTLDASLPMPGSIHMEFLKLPGVILIVFGTSIISASTFSLMRHGKGLPVSSLPPSEFVQTGCFRYSRHPIYTGAIFLFAGLCTLLSSFWGLVLATPLLATFYLTYARGIEEPVLIERFGKQYLEYRSETPLFLPFPFRTTFAQWGERLLTKISGIVNKPRITQFGPHLFFWGYGIWPGFGVFIGLAYMEFILLSQGVAANISALVILLMTIFSLFGVRLTWQFVTAFRKKSSYQKTKEEVGFMSWGTLLALGLTTVIYTTVTEYPVSILLDAILPGFLIAHFWGRIGCLFYGCCYGKHADPGPHVHYTHPALKVIRTGQSPYKKTIPVQLFSSLYGLLGSLFIFLLWYGNAIPAGIPASIAAIWYCSFRIDEEWLRKQSVVWMKIISPAQVVAFGLLIFALIWIIFGIPENPQNYPELISGQEINVIFGKMHFLLLAVSGFLTALLFSYHHKEIGKWKTRE